MKKNTTAAAAASATKGLRIRSNVRAGEGTTEGGTTDSAAGFVIGLLIRGGRR